VIAVVATDVGAWRVVRPVVGELRRRGETSSLMLAEPAASYAAREGLAYDRLDQVGLEARARSVLGVEPSILLLGTSVSDVVERTLARQARHRLPTIGVLDAMLFVERRFGPDLAELPDLVACPDAETAERLRRAGAQADQLVVTGNPVLEEIGSSSHQTGSWGERRTDILFVSQPVTELGRSWQPFSIDERESLDHLLGALESLEHLAPAGFRVRVRWHPVQRAEQLPRAPQNVQLVVDDDDDRLRSAARARIVVGLSSTLLTEARMLPRSAIAYLPGPYWDHEMVYPPHQGVRAARSRESLRAYLAEALVTEPEPAPTRFHGGAAVRVADLLLTASPF
jgi:hypothetical protein